MKEETNVALWLKEPSTVFQIISDVNPNRGGFHLDSFACQSLNAFHVVSFHAVANLRAETEVARNRSEYEMRELSTENATYDKTVR